MKILSSTSVGDLRLKLPDINKGALLNYIRSQISRYVTCPQLKLEAFLPQVQGFLRHLKSLPPQEASALRNEYSELISCFLLDLEKDREIVITYRPVFGGRVPIIEAYSYNKVSERNKVRERKREERKAKVETGYFVIILTMYLTISLILPPLVPALVNYFFPPPISGLVFLCISFICLCLSAWIVAKMIRSKD